MKNLMLFVHPSKDFLPEYKIAIKIQIENSLSLGWKKEDIILATNFPYEYNGVKSILVSDDNYCDFNVTVTKFNVIVELFDRNLIEKNELYWYHDEDVFEFYKITESELDLGKADIALANKGIKSKLDSGIIYFKYSAGDIFRWVKEIAYKYRENEEYALMALYTNNLLWITETESIAREKIVPLNFPGTKDISQRLKELNQRYNFGVDNLNQIYNVAKKPIKIAHFPFGSDFLVDSVMYGKNAVKKVLMPKRLIKIFHKHGIKRIFPKKLKNLMICLNSEKKLPQMQEKLIKKQIDTSLKLGWKREDLVLITNFPHLYNGVKALLIEDKLFAGINEKAINTAVILHLLEKGFIGNGELWWFHNLNVFQDKPFKSKEIELDGMTAGFINLGNFFFRENSNKLFEWIRNRANRLKGNEQLAFKSLADVNYRNINLLYRELKIDKIASRK
jgi:hypothetical protein